MLINHAREKLINSILYFQRETYYCGKTKLFKLLYYLDFIHFKETGRSVTDLDYYAWDNGPVPKVLYDEFKNPSRDLTDNMTFKMKTRGDEKFFEITPLKKFNDNYFTKREMRILTQLSSVFRYARAVNMSDVSHFPNHPWDKTIKTKGKQAKIDYMLSLDDTPQSIKKEEAIERRKFKEALKKYFN